jgi:hypothetical protein
MRQREMQWLIPSMWLSCLIVQVGNPQLQSHATYHDTWASHAVLCVQVFLCARSQQDVDAALASFKQQGYVMAGMAADVTQKEQREQLVQQVCCLYSHALAIAANLANSVLRMQATSV